MIPQSHPFSILVAYLLDLLLADPTWLPHPIVGFGHLISPGEHHLNHGHHRVAKGALLVVLLTTFTFAITALLIWLCRLASSWLDVMVQAVLGFYCLAGTTLRREVRQVFQATDQSLEAGRRQVARIVGRDTSQLSAQEVRTAALETLAENLSDGVVAPLFWYALLGLPGMMTYKMINTLDSMIGYRNARYLRFGRVAARLDDVANFLPARLTALLMVCAAGRPALLPWVLKNGRQHASPNSGYPEAALASILDCRFGGPHHYFGREVWKPYIGTHTRELTHKDMEKAIAINIRAEWCMMVMVVVWACYSATCWC